MFLHRFGKLLFVAMVGVLLWMTVSAFWPPGGSANQEYSDLPGSPGHPRRIEREEAGVPDETSPTGIVDSDEVRRQHELHKGGPRQPVKRPRRTYNADQPISHDGFGRAMLEWGLLGSTSFNGSKPEFVKNLSALNGQPATLVGFMSPLEEVGQLRTFMLLEYPVGCFYCLVPDPAGIVLVDLKAGKTEPLRYEPVRVAGKLRLNDSDPEDFLYILEDAEVMSLD